MSLSIHFLGHVARHRTVIAAIAVGGAVIATLLPTSAIGDVDRDLVFKLVVGPDGDDRHPGTPAEPLATLQEAQRRVRARLAAEPPANVVVQLRGGTYRLTESLVITSLDGGTEKFAVRYEAWPGEKPVLSGGTVVPKFRVADDGVWHAPLPRRVSTTPRHLFIGGKRAVRARSPNVGYFTGITTDNGHLLTFPTDTVGDWSHPSEVELLTLVEWSASRAVTTGRVLRKPNERAQIDFGHQVMLFCFDDWAGHLRAEIPNFPFYFENAREMLDAPGEWHSDPVARTLRYLPRDGEQLDEVAAVVPVLETLIDLRGTVAAPVRNLHFDGIAFEETTWRLPAEGYFPLQAGRTKAMAINRGEKETSLPTPAVRLQFAQNCSLTNCRFERLGGVGLQIARGCSAVAVQACVLRDISGCGIEIGEQLSQQPEAEIVSDTRIEDCEITLCGVDNPGIAGVSVLIARGTRIAHNHLHQLPYSGITCGWNWTHSDTVARDNIIAHNHIHDVLLEMADGGGVYTLGKQPGSRIIGNHIHDIRRTRGIAGSNGIFMDNGSEGWHVEGNIVYEIADAPVRFNTTDTSEKFQTWGKNWLGIPPTSPEFPVLLAGRAGPRR